MLPNANILTTVNTYLGNSWVDQVLRDNKFFGEVLANTEKFKAGVMNFPMKYQKGVASVSFNGFDQLPTSQQPVSVNMTFYPAFVATNVALSGTDLSVNQTEMQTIDLMKVTMQSRAQDAADDVGNYFQGNGVGKDPAGLGNIVDDGSVASTYGGLSRATYTGLNATVTASGGTISLLKVRQLSNSISAVPAAALSLAIVIANEPAATVVTVAFVFPPLEPLRIETNTTSSISTFELVTVNAAVASAASDVVFVVIAPESALIVTPVVRFVCCVTVAPWLKFPSFPPILVKGS